MDKIEKLDKEINKSLDSLIEIKKDIEEIKRNKEFVNRYGFLIQIPIILIGCSVGFYFILRYYY